MPLDYFAGWDQCAAYNIRLGVAVCGIGFFGGVALLIFAWYLRQKKQQSRAVVAMAVGLLIVIASAWLFFIGDSSVSRTIDICRKPGKPQVQTNSPTAPVSNSLAPQPVDKKVIENYGTIYKDPEGRFSMYRPVDSAIQLPPSGYLARFTTTGGVITVRNAPKKQTRINPETNQEEYYVSGVTRTVILLNGQKATIGTLTNSQGKVLTAQAPHGGSYEVSCSYTDETADVMFGVCAATLESFVPLL